MIQYCEILAFWQLLHFFIQGSSPPPSILASLFKYHVYGKSLVLSFFVLANVIDLGL